MQNPKFPLCSRVTVCFAVFGCGVEPKADWQMKINTRFVFTVCERKTHIPQRATHPETARASAQQLPSLRMPRNYHHHPAQLQLPAAALRLQTAHEARLPPPLIIA